MHKVVVQNEQFTSLKNAPVEVYNTKTGEVLERVNTDGSGVAEFSGSYTDGEYWFRPQVTRRSGKNQNQSLGGQINFHEVDKPTQQVTLNPAGGRNNIPQALRGNAKVSVGNV